MRERQSLFTMVRVGTVMAARAVSLAACLSVTHTAGVTPTARSAAAARCPAASYGARSYAPGGAKTVALTFDDGPGQSTAAILAILARYRVPATFFNIGVNMAARPSLVRAEVKGGYAMGNHTGNHPDLDDLTTAQQAAELDEVIAEQRSITGTVPCGSGPVRGLRSHHAQAGAATPDGRVAVVGRHPGLDGRRLGIGLLGQSRHPPR